MIDIVREQQAPGLIGVVRRHLKKALAAIAICLLLGLVYTAVTPVDYGSEAKIFVRIGRESISLDPTATTGQTVNLQDSRENELNSVLETLTSRAVLEGVVDDLGPSVILGRDGLPDPIQETGLGDQSATQPHPSLLQKVNPLTSYSRRDDAIQKLAKRLSVTNAKKSDIITVYCEGQSPEAARKIVTKVIDLTRDNHTRVNRIVGSVDFFTEQTDAQRKHLTELEMKMRDLKNQSGVAFLPQQREIQLHHIGDLQAELQRVDRALTSGNAQTLAVQTRMKRQSPTVTLSEVTGLSDTAAARMRDQLYSLQIREHELASKFTDENPQLIAVRNQLAGSQTTFDAEQTPPQVTKGENRTFKDLELAWLNGESSLESLQAEQKILTTQIADSRGELKKLNDVEQQMVALERDIEVVNKDYGRYAENLEQARIGQELATQRISNINILQQPTLSPTPVKPKALFNLAIAIGLGLVVAAAVVAVSEQRRRDRLGLNRPSMGNGNGNGYRTDYPLASAPSDPNARRIVYQK